MKKIIFVIIAASILSACSSITINNLPISDVKQCRKLYDDNVKEARNLVKNEAKKYDKTHIYKRINVKSVENHKTHCVYKYEFLAYNTPNDLQEISFKFYISK